MQSRIRQIASMLVLGSLLCACAPTAVTEPAVEDIATAVAATMQVMEKNLAPEPEETLEEPLGTTIELLPTTESVSPPLIPPDVLHIAYTNDGNIWLIREGSDPIQLTTSGNAQTLRISSDGAWIAYRWNDLEQENVEIRAVSTASGTEHTLMDQGDLDSLYPLENAQHYVPSQMEFIPGTADLLLNTQATFVGPGQLKNDDLIRLNVITGEYQQLLPPGSGGDFSISPDHSLVALVQADRLGFAGIDGVGLQPAVLSFELVITYSEFKFYPLITWSADSSQFVVVIPSSDPLSPQPSGTIWRIPLDGTTPIRQGVINGQTYFPQLSGYPLISPDLSHVVFTRPVDDSNESEFFFANLDGSLETRYARGNIQWSGWNPDSVRFVFGVEPQELQIGSVAQPSSPFIAGIDLRWLNPDEYLFLAGERGNWRLQQGQVGSQPAILVNPAGDFISYDFVQ